MTNTERCAFSGCGARRVSKVHLTPEECGCTPEECGCNVQRPHHSFVADPVSVPKVERCAYRDKHHGCGYTLEDGPHSGHPDNTYCDAAYCHAFVVDPTSAEEDERAFEEWWESTKGMDGYMYGMSPDDIAREGWCAAIERERRTRTKV